MVETLAVTEGVSLLKKFAGPVIGGAVLLAVGFGAAEAWEHSGPRPTVFGWSIFGQSLKQKLAVEIASEPVLIATAQKAGMNIQLAADKIVFDQWAVRLQQDEAALTQQRNAAASSVTAQDKFTTTQAAQAFAMGRASCETTNANPFPSTPGVAAPGGVRPTGLPDFHDIFEPGAFTAPA